MRVVTSAEAAKKIAEAPDRIEMIALDLTDAAVKKAGPRRGARRPGKRRPGRVASMSGQLARSRVSVRLMGRRYTSRSSPQPAVARSAAPAPTSTFPARDTA